MRCTTRGHVRTQSARHAGACEDRGIFQAVRSQACCNNAACLLPQVAGLAASGRGFGVGIGVHRRHVFAHKILDEIELPPTGCVVRVAGTTDPRRKGARKQDVDPPGT